MERIAVLMTCYNRVETTLRCLRGLTAQKLPEGYAIDVWLVDDGSTDGTGEAVGKCLNVGMKECLNRSAGGSGHSNIQTFHNSNITTLHVIRSQGGLFWCKGMRLAWDAAVGKCLNFGIRECLNEGAGKCLNVGMKECLNRSEGGSDHSNIQTFKHSNISPVPDFFLWLNDDVILKSNAIAGLLADYKKVGGVIAGTFSSDETEREVSYGATGNLPDGTPHPGDCGMNGNLVLIPRDVYEKVGPICGAYSHQYGDYDYGWQVRKRGMEYYSSSSFCGVCPQQPERYQHRLREYGLIKRVKLLFDPKGYSLHDAFLYKYRNWGLARALLSVVHVTGKVLMGIG